MMKQSFMWAGLSSLALLGSACAQETPETNTTELVEQQAAAFDPLADIYEDPNAAHWRVPDPENTLYIETKTGRIVVELAPFAPRHTERLKTLARQGFYDRTVFHRVIDDFMVQGGDPTGTGMGDSDLPDLDPEFTFRRDVDTQPVIIVSERVINPRKPFIGQGLAAYLDGFPVITRPAAQAAFTEDGKVETIPVHCPGVTSMARGEAENSANSQFFLMRYNADHLNADYSVWGRVIDGQEHVLAVKVGTVGDVEAFVPDSLVSMKVAADVDAEERIDVRVLDTNSQEFKRWMTSQRGAGGVYPDICNMPTPTLIVEKQ